MPEVLVLPRPVATIPTTYLPAQLHTRNRRRQYQTTDGRFQLRRAADSEAYFWHPVEKPAGRTLVGDPLSGPDDCFSCCFGQKAEALATLNALCAHYGL